MYFDGFVVQDPNDDKDGINDDHLEDTRIFEPQEEPGSLAFHTNDRFFASTASPLSEGLCGAPALDADGELCGVVEGIVPVDHENPKIAGTAAFLPSFVLASFVDYTERVMLEQIMPEDMFQNVVQAKLTNTLGGGSFNLVKDGKPQEEGIFKQAYERQVEMLKKKYSKEEVDAMLWNVKVSSNWYVEQALTSFLTMTSVETLKALVMPTNIYSTFLKPIAPILVVFFFVLQYCCSEKETKC